MLQYVRFSETNRAFNAQRALAWYLIAVGGAALIDASSKLLAINTLTGNSVELGDRFALMLVYNPGGAGGVSWGPYTWLMNVCVTSLAIVMISFIVVHLAKVDRRASLALGLVVGGAAGNLGSMLARGEGVPDFMAIRFTEGAVVCNAADLALWSGAMLLVPVVRSLLRAIRAERVAKRSHTGELVNA